MRPDLADVLGAAAGRAVEYPYRRWGYGEGPALRGALRAARVLGRGDLAGAVLDIVAPTLHARPDEEIDHLIPVEVLVEARRARPALDIGPAVRRFVAATAGAYRPVPGRPRVHRPHHPALGRLIWVDCLHTDGPGLVAAGYPAAAVAVTREAVQVLQDGSGLFSHGYRVDAGAANRVHWARGQGWALYGLVGLLRAVPGRRDLRDALDRLVAALARYEVAGRWRTIVDDATSPAELSLSPMVAGQLRRGVREGVVDPRHHDLADRALAATLDAVRPDGTILVSEATPVGPATTYHDRGEGVYPWGQGPLLDALLDAMGDPT